MLTIEEIKKELDAGREVELECVDNSGFLGKKDAQSAYNNAALDSGLRLTKYWVDGEGKVIFRTIEGLMLIDYELKHFRIKRPAPTLKDLSIGDKVFIREDLEDEKEYEFGLYFFKDSMSTGEQIISDVCGEGINIEGDDSNRYSHSMIDWEKTAELNAKKAPTFDDLKRVATKAVEDGIIFSIEIFEDSVFIYLDSAGYDTNKPSFAIVRDLESDIINIPSIINKINSLYTETFVIEQENDLIKTKVGATGKLLNGEEFTIVEAYCRGYVAVDECKYYLPFFVFKGATVTQKRGNV